MQIFFKVYLPATRPCYSKGVEKLLSRRGPRFSTSRGIEIVVEARDSFFLCKRSCLSASERVGELFEHLRAITGEKGRKVGLDRHVME